MIFRLGALVAVYLVLSCFSIDRAIAKELKFDPAISFKQDFPSVTYLSIEATSIEGLYEVVAGNNVFYYYPKSGVLFIGEIITKQFKNLTAEKRNTLLTSRLKELPLKKAIRIGDGKNTVIEFMDVDCPYCRKLEAYFENRKDVTRYVYLFPLEDLHPDALKKSISILCSGNPATAYKNAMRGGLDGKDLPECANKEQATKLLDVHKELAQGLAVQGTPALWVNNAPVAGANTSLIDQLLSSSSNDNSIKGGEKR